MTVSVSNHANSGSGTPAPIAMVFVQDQDSENIIRQSFSNLGITSVVYSKGGIGAAIAELSHAPSPRLLVVDVSGSEAPDGRINELAQVTDPSTSVVVIGDTNDVRLYRNLKDVGASEYYFKPLVGTLIADTFNKLLNGATKQRGPRTGKLIFAISVRGGSGATTIATWSAWYFAEMRRRKVLLLDLNLLAGDAALQLDVMPTHALREAIEHPERVDDLFLERAVVQVTKRLGILASLEPLDEAIAWHDEVILSLLQNLLNRYHYAFVDFPAWIVPELARVLQLPSTCMLISDGSLVAARDISRWRDRIITSSAERTVVHILNKNGAPGGLPMDEFVRIVGKEPDIVIPNDRDIAVASTIGIRRYSSSHSLHRQMSPVLKMIGGEVVEERRSIFGKLFG